LGGTGLRLGTSRAIAAISEGSYGAAVAGACAGRPETRSTGRTATGRLKSLWRFSTPRREAFDRPEALAEEAVEAPPKKSEAVVDAPPNEVDAVISGRNSRETCFPGANESRVRILRGAFHGSTRW
jgi:hypothetical protein